MVTYLSGQAVQQAAFALREKLIQLAATLLGCWPQAVRLERGAAVGPRRSKINFADLAARAKSNDESLSARGSIDIKERLGAMCFFAEAAEVRVESLPRLCGRHGAESATAFHDFRLFSM